ncbi:MAG: CNNM domain-containing protein, partial [Myxococcales bacterium]
MLLNGFFVATEFALVKVRPTQLDALAAGGSKAASRARQLVDKLDEYLSATQLGITLASLGLGWIGEPAFARLIEPAARRFGLSETAVDATGGAIAFLIITFLHIVFGELAPKSLAIQRAEGTSLAVSAPMKLFYAVFYPAIWALNGLAGSVLRLVRLPPVSESEKAHTEEELRMIFAS